MKTIEFTDEDHATLLELCKEIQTQENDGQAFPYFWEPMSGRYKPSPIEEGEVVFEFEGKNHTPESMWENDVDAMWEDRFDELKRVFDGCRLRCYNEQTFI